jgi:hypothetical protein
MSDREMNSSNNNNERDRDTSFTANTNRGRFPPVRYKCNHEQIQLTNMYK